MAAPTEAEIQNQIADVIKLLDESRLFGSVNTDNVVGMIDALVVNLEGDQSGQVLAATEAFRDAFASVLRLGRQMVDPLLRTYGKERDFPDTDPTAILARLYEDFDDNSKSVKERNFTFGSPAAGGSNVGDGLLQRLTLDRRGHDLEAQTPDAKSVRCLQDASSGARAHQETFEVRGGNPSRDNFALEGSGRVSQLKGLSGADSEVYLQNPSFAQFAGTSITAMTEIIGWTFLNAIANFELVEGAANIYRTYTGEGATPRSVKFETSDKLSQKFSVRQATFDPFTPYYCQIAVNKTVGTAVGGSMTLRLGNKNVTSTIVALGTNWQVMRIVLGLNSWFENWNEDDPDLEIEWSSATSGFMLVDDVIISPFTAFDGAYYAMLGGRTPFLFDDTFTFTDTEIGAKIQFWLWFLYGVYLPHSATPTWADPA